MVQRFLKIVLFFIVLINIYSCRIYSKDNQLKEKVNELPQLNIYDISWGDCMRYGKPYNDNDSLIVIDGLGISKESYKYKSNFYKKIYVKTNCKYSITYKGTVLNGTYKINNINPSIEGKKIIGSFRPEYFIATFEKGKREGHWYYFPMEDYDGKNNTEVVKALTGNKNYKPFIQPIKIEIYKNGLPNGEWWQKSEKEIEYFIYKDGDLINERREVIDKK